MNVHAPELTVITLPATDSWDMNQDSIPDDPFHQINTALTVIIGNAQLLQRKLERGDTVSPDLLILALARSQQMGHYAALEVNSLRRRNEE